MVDPEASIADDVAIGPFCVVQGPVTLEAGVRLLSHVNIQGPAVIGARTTVFPFAAIGHVPQDFKFKAGDVTAGVRIGPDSLIRENVSVHASSNDHTPTTLGERVMLMASSHVAHDCQLGDNVILVNYAGLSGHTVIGNNATLSGHCGTHQHVRIGRLAFFSAGTHVSMDVPPFCVVNERNRLGSVNLVGMRRSGMPRTEITAVRETFRAVFRHPTPREDMLGYLAERAEEVPALAELHEFVSHSKRGIVPGIGKVPRLMAAALQRLRRTGEIDFDDDED